MSGIIKQGLFQYLSREGGKELLPFMAQLRHEFGGWWIAVFQLSFHLCM